MIEYGLLIPICPQELFGVHLTTPRHDFINKGAGEAGKHDSLQAFVIAVYPSEKDGIVGISRVNALSVYKSAIAPRVQVDLDDFSMLEYGGYYIFREWFFQVGEVLDCFIC